VVFIVFAVVHFLEGRRSHGHSLRTFGRTG
jgi:hypothetical protein